MKKSICTVLALSLVFLCSCGKEERGRSYSGGDGNSLSYDESTSLTGSPEIEELHSQINLSTVIDTKSSFSGYPINADAAVIKGSADPSALAGLSPLPGIKYSVTQKRTDIHLSDEKLSHSHGPASGGQPHHTVVDFQKTFDKFGAYTLDSECDGKVLYLTFDCGYEYENLTSKVLDTLKEKQVPAAFFCTLDHLKNEPEIISRIIKEGHIVGNHSATHPCFADISREQMVRELEETENYLRENYGYASKFFRFPAGEYTENALDLVASLGYVSVFWSVAYNDWNVDKIQGADYATETVMSRLHNGAIILLHSVSRDNAEALGNIIDRARAEGYEFRPLTALSN